MNDDMVKANPAELAGFYKWWHTPLPIPLAQILGNVTMGNAVARAQANDAQEQLCRLAWLAGWEARGSYEAHANCTDPDNGVHAIDCPANPRYQP